MGMAVWGPIQTPMPYICTGINVIGLSKAIRETLLSLAAAAQNKPDIKPMLSAQDIMRHIGC